MFTLRLQCILGRETSSSRRRIELLPKLLTVGRMFSLNYRDSLVTKLFVVVRWLFQFYTGNTYTLGSKCVILPWFYCTFWLWASTLASCPPPRSPLPAGWVWVGSTALICRAPCPSGLGIDPLEMSCNCVWQCSRRHHHTMQHAFFFQ